MYKKIMVPLDGSELAECVLPHVEAIAKGCSAAEVVLVRAVEPFQMPPYGDAFGSYAPNVEDIKKADLANQARAKEYIEQVAGRVQLGGAKVQTQVLFGKAADSLAEYATKNDVDIIVIATHGRSGVSRWVWGSVSDRILRSACVPVLMVRAPGCIPGI
jgi:nucleotide-binding universal stress UspA family protein